jgi:hypothetical protein
MTEKNFKFQTPNFRETPNTKLHPASSKHYGGQGEAPNTNSKFL